MIEVLANLVAPAGIEGVGAGAPAIGEQLLRLRAGAFRRGVLLKLGLQLMKPRQGRCGGRVALKVGQLLGRELVPTTKLLAEGCLGKGTGGALGWGCVVGGWQG